MSPLDEQQEGNPLFFGLLTCAFGLLFIGISIWGSDAGFHAPHWVVGAAGGTFLLAGMAILGQDLPLFSALVRALLMTAFGAVISWVSFGPGEREFTSSVSVPFLSFSRSASDLSGRICFAPGAILLDGLAIYLWFQLVRNWLLRDLYEE